MEANLKVVFQVQEGPEGSEKVERWPEKLRRMARYFGVKPNELANRMIAAGILALEREDPTTSRILSSSIAKKSSFPRWSNIKARRNSPKASICIRMFRRNWSFIGLIEVTNLHNRELVHGLLKGKSVQETFSDISRDTTLSQAYLDKLKSIYTSPVSQHSIEAHPLREKKLKKETIDAWVEDWRRINRSKQSERSIIADITALLRTVVAGRTPQGPGRGQYCALRPWSQIARKPCMFRNLPARCRRRKFSNSCTLINSHFKSIEVVAGVGFEPTTFRL